MPRMLVAMIVVTLVVAGGLLLFITTRTPGSGARAEVGADDSVLQRLRASNPSLQIEKRLDDDFNRIPVYWIRTPNAQVSIPFPKSFAEEDNVVVEFVVCDNTAIAPRLKFPDAATTACVRVTSVAHVLNAFCYHAVARLNDVITHYDGPATGRRFEHRYAEKTGLDGLQPDGSKGLLYSYSLFENGSGTTFEVDAFIGYKRERRD